MIMKNEFKVKPNNRIKKWTYLTQQKTLDEKEQNES